MSGLAAAALLVPLGACTSEAPAPAASGNPPGLDRFHQQTLKWTACDDYATTETESTIMALVDGLECARMQAPLSYDDPGGRTIEVAVARRAATGDKIGSLVTNPGGPGGSGVFGAATTALGLIKAKSPLVERFDLVGFDPRGVGSTEPAVDCYTDEEADRGIVPLTTQGTTVQWTEDDTRALVERCAKGSGGPDVLAHLGTRDVARDMDILRVVLGDEKFTFLGQSYGTRLGAVYAEQFPRNVRAMLLDGAIDSRQGTMERRVFAFSGFQAAFDRMAAFCARQAGCPIGRDPEAATAEFQKIVRPLYDKPVPALGGELDFDAAVGGVISGLYTQAAWPRIIKGLGQLRQGRGDELAQLGFDFSGRDAKGAWTNFAEALYAINCMDEQRLSEQQGNELRAAVIKSAPFMDPGVALTGARDGCEHWPAPPTLGFPYAQNIQGLPRTLVVSITGDPTTPHAGGVRLAESLGSALLTVRGEGHTIVTAGTNPCVNKAAADYLIDLKVPAAGATCTL
ncbi:alpha/beta hydrolase [Paractinoplanes abujensis]|uniref:Pimeloyl-ACP methyl ester carboxylesterase n=1 Tax=Paractinoplanes abujensis TaxID=882441 RepID=A0A7W7CRV1_9ACTN|nr:alpha/beta hydrolase [Actinoplanes abujensis]MBB4693214.1 pimeloyl-ACP methyl ester carboxylesterase [Actinoplanes abujensis]GID24413.1 alpha/beta hydrolase [Actinoplanes abujensis]